MKHPIPGDEHEAVIENQPEPWERQPGEPLDRYRLFQIYLTLPQPRRCTTVSQTVGLSPAGRLVPQAASRWNWEKRAAACDFRGAALTGLLNDWRNQLLNEVAYVARFIGLHATGRALDSAAIQKMDRAGLRNNLAALDRLQRSILSLIAPMKEVADQEFDEKELHWPIVERAGEIRWEWTEPIARKVFSEPDPDTANERDGNTAQKPDPALDTPQSRLGPTAVPNLPGETVPWERQPEEPASLFYAFRIYLSLKFLQSTRQVAKMAAVAGRTTLACKWNWEKRAAAFEAHYAGQPLARFDLQHQLLLDKAYELQLHGLSQSNAALEKAQIDRLDRATVRKHLPLLIRRQRGLLQQLARIIAASDRKLLDQRRDVRLTALVEEKALQMATENWYDSLRIIETIYGNQETPDDEKE
ncbi:MAG: hypothetical protein OXJ55_09850 [Caldilineaceae bacterium]|nr:hypothetical protein [Caldilineaceae bacterium]MDE0462723.1 hypothetical protein [Caldilineaceae bacterium]